jgi:hypothetical protein
MPAPSEQYHPIVHGHRALSRLSQSNADAGRDRTNATYLKETPIRLAERQATWQSRFVGSA